MPRRPEDKVGTWEAGAIADVVPAGCSGKSGRIRLHDKKMALDAVARPLCFSTNSSLGRKKQSAVAKRRAVHCAKGCCALHAARVDSEMGSLLPQCGYM